MLREEVEQYTKLTGEDGWHVPIMKVGAYLDGYDKGLEILDKIREEIRALAPKGTAEDVIEGNPIKEAVWETIYDVLKIIDKFKAEKVSNDEKDIYLDGYSDAMKEHNIFIKNVKEYMDNYDYIKAKERYNN